ncbi:MAG: AAA family ATPase, partial [Patescibacteria group bacterium]
KDSPRLKEIEKELKKLHQLNSKLSDKWQSEKAVFETLHELRRKIDNLKREAELSERSGNLERVAQIIYGELPQAQKDFQLFEKEHFERPQKSNDRAGKKDNKNEEESHFLKDSVDKEDVAAIVASWTGIPIRRILESEAEKLIKVEDVLGRRVVGQEEAIKAVSNALRRARAGLSDENRPLGSFMFLGPSGVGKTELARTLAEFLFNDEKAMLRFDMSEYMERHTTSRLVGSPPGYVGHEEGGQLTEAIRHRPYSLILFDEIEKAHPEVFNLLLQILDDGRLTDSKGKRVNFRNSIIIMTSNVGSQYLRAMSSLGFGSEEDGGKQAQVDDYKGKILEALRESFRPEFLNRVDEITIFNPLKLKDIQKIVDIQLGLIEKRLARRRIQISLDAPAREYLAKEGFSPDFGARPLKRLIQKVILDKLADQIIRGELKDGGKVKVNFKADSLVFNS